MTTTAAANTDGFLAIFSDVEPVEETDYLHWLTREHVQERLGVPGFLAVRVFRAEAGGLARFFIFYQLADAAVVGSADYLARLNAPSAWSQRIMPKLKNFVRGGGAIAFESGTGEGAFVFPVLLGADEIETSRKRAPELAGRDRMTAARLFVTEQQATTIATNEKSMRQGDTTFAALLLLEGTDETALKQTRAAIGVARGDAAPFRQIFALRKEQK